MNLPLEINGFVSTNKNEKDHSKDENSIIDTNNENENENANSQESSSNNSNSSSSSTMNEKICWICHENDENDQLDMYCKCNIGDLQYSHSKCLSTWIQTNSGNTKNCPRCHYEYKYKEIIRYQYLDYIIKNNYFPNIYNFIIFFLPSILICLSYPHNSKRILLTYLLLKISLVFLIGYLYKLYYEDFYYSEICQYMLSEYNTLLSDNHTFTIIPSSDIFQAFFFTMIFGIHQILCEKIMDKLKKFNIIQVELLPFS